VGGRRRQQGAAFSLVRGAGVAENGGVARPLRKLYPLQLKTRQRHRTWMWSMTLATLGMAIWGIVMVALEYVPERVPHFRWVFAAAGLFAVPGFVLGLLTLRARRAWLLVALVPLLANGMLLVLPWVVHRLREAGA